MCKLYSIGITYIPKILYFNQILCHILDRMFAVRFFRNQVTYWHDIKLYFLFKNNYIRKLYILTIAIYGIKWSNYQSLSKVKKSHERNTHCIIKNCPQTSSLSRAYSQSLIFNVIVSRRVI